MRKIIYENIGWTILVYVLIAFHEAKADVYKGKEDIHKDGKPSTVYNVNKHGKLYPFKTYNFYDSLTRPKYWNGYGVDPHEANYYHYWNKETECYEGYRDVWEGTDYCKEWEDRKDKEGKDVPEPEPMGMFGMSLLALALYKWVRNG